jgi:hypothetical protein
MNSDGYDWELIYLQNEGINMLGKSYLTGFDIGEYVEWRTLVRNEDYEEIVRHKQGIIMQLKATDMSGRMVYYAEVMENGGRTYWILLSKIRKVETN